MTWRAGMERAIHGSKEPTREELLKALYRNDRRGSKFNVDLSEKGKEARTYDNIVFDSVREMECYRDYVKPQVKAGLFRNLRLQHPMPLFAFHPVRNEPVLVAYYVPDFVFEDTDGKTHVVDVKGRATAVYRLKKRWWSVCYPDLRIEEL